MKTWRAFTPLERKLHLSFLTGFTLMELLIVIALIAILVIAALTLLNPLKQIQKSWDGKRKTELGQLRKVLEDWYNDKNCYPKPDQICYKDKTQTICPICGRQSGSPSFSPYLPSLPCDPQSPGKEYLYQVEDADCPSSYKIYAILSELPQSGSYNYGVSSGNTNLEPYPAVSPTATPILSPSPSPTINPFSSFYCSSTGCLPCEEGGDPTACYNFPPERFCNSELKIYGDLYGCQAPPPPVGTGCPCD